MANTIQGSMENTGTTLSARVHGWLDARFRSYRRNTTTKVLIAFNFFV